MRSKLLSVLTVIGVVTVLVLAANTVALATTGKALLAGKINTASKMTSITRTTAGTGLQVKTKKTTDSPFAVNGKGKVVNLNADTVDGKDSSVLGTRALVWAYAGTATASQSHTWKTATMPAGYYLINYEVFLGSTDGSIDCYLRRNNENLYAGEDSSTATPLGTSLTGAGVIGLVSPGFVQLSCNDTDSVTWAFEQSQPVRITAIPLPGYTLKGAPSVSRVAARTK